MGDPARGGRHGDRGLTIGREGLGPVFDFIKSCGDRPYFVWFAPMMPHEPHNPPERLLGKYLSVHRSPAVAKYLAMCEWFDETCGQLVDFLERRGQREKTLIIFVVDNGWVPRELGQAPKGRPKGNFAARSKLSPYDGGIRTPILVSWPGTIAPADYPTLVSSIDIAPTVLTAAGLAKGTAMQGLNLADVIAHDGHSARSVVFGEIFDHDVVDLDNPVPGLRYRWCVERNWKLICPANSSQPPELYDVIADPTEFRDRAKERPDLVRLLTGKINNWWHVRG